MLCNGSRSGGTLKSESCTATAVLYGFFIWYSHCIPVETSDLNSVSFRNLVQLLYFTWCHLVIGCMNIIKRMSRTLAEAGPTLRVTLFMGEAAQASH